MPSLEDLVLRRAGPDDRSGILQLLGCCPEDYVPRVLDAWLGESPGGALVARERAPGGGEGRVLAFTSTSFPRPGEAWFQGIRVRPDCQGRGVGLALSRYQVQDAAAQGARVARLLVLTHNARARRLVEDRLGFSRWGPWSVVEWAPGQLRSAPGTRAAAPGAPPAGRWLRAGLARRRKRAQSRGPGARRTSALIPPLNQLWTVCALGDQDLPRLLGPQSLWWPRPGRSRRGAGGPPPPLAGAALERLERATGTWVSVCWLHLPPGPPGVAPALGLLKAVGEAAWRWGAEFAAASLPHRREGPLLAALRLQGWKPQDEEREWYHEAYIYEFFFS